MTTDINSMKVNERVRGLLIKDGNKILLIRRQKLGRDVYWVFPGGGKEESDASLESALRREVFEELAASIDINKMVYIEERTEGDAITKESFFLCTVKDYDFDRKSGPEFSDSSRGLYDLEEVALNEEDLGIRNIQPEDVKNLMLRNLENIFGLPDVRDGS